MATSQVIASITFVVSLTLSVATPSKFVERPAHFAQGFPAPDSFLKTGGRRLRASEGKPARTRYESEQMGHKFVYEFAGTSSADRIINLDKELGVSGLHCEHAGSNSTLGNDRMWLVMASRNRQEVLGGLPFVPKVGDVLTGGPEWGCNRNGKVGFLVEVISVKSEGSAIVVETRDTSPFLLFQDLFIDFTWLKVPGPDSINKSGDTRRLYDIEHDIFRWSMNEYFNKLGLNCHAKVDTFLRFQLRGAGFVVDRISLSLGADLDFKAELSSTPEQIKSLVKNGWYEFKSVYGDDLLKGLVDALQIPFFNELNQATINLQLRPAFQTKTWVDVQNELEEDLIDNLLEPKLTAYFNTNGDSAAWEVFWDKNTGFGMTLPDGSDFKTGVTIEGLKYPDGLMTTLKQCMGIDLLALGDRVTGLQLCPAQRTMIWNGDGDDKDGSSMIVPEGFGKSYMEPDSTLCFDIKSFETNIDKKALGGDTAMVKACFHGECVETSAVSAWSGNLITFSDGLQCIPVRRSSLQANGIFLHAIESTLWAGWNQYTAPLELRGFPEQCLGSERCILTYDFPAPNKRYAKVTLSLTLDEKKLTQLGNQTRASNRTRRLGFSKEGSERPARLLEGKESYVCTNYDVSTSFSGVRYGLDGFNVVDPVHEEAIRTQEPICKIISQSMISAASHQTGVWLASLFSLVILLMR